MKNITKKWIELAEYDLKSASVMLLNKRYLYVAFMCQQSVEKYFKAYITEISDIPPPYTHNLAVLAKISGLEFTTLQEDFLSNLTRHYIKARYPSVKEKLSRSLSGKTANDMLNETKEIIKCLKGALKISAK